MPAAVAALIFQSTPPRREVTPPITIYTAMAKDFNPHLPEGR